jgi:hypothetical protein
MGFLIQPPDSISSVEGYGGLDVQRREFGKSLAYVISYRTNSIYYFLIGGNCLYLSPNQRFGRGLRQQ